MLLSPIFRSQPMAALRTLAKFSGAESVRPSASSTLGLDDALDGEFNNLKRTVTQPKSVIQRGLLSNEEFTDRNGSA